MRRPVFVAIFLGAAAQIGAAFADPLTPEEVALSAAQLSPSVLIAEAKRDQADAKTTEALGGFDTRIEAESKLRPQGYYDGRFGSLTARRALGPLGAEVYGGYRISDGEFPIYEDINFTNQAGEAMVGLAISLLRDREIDSIRFGLTDASLGLAQEELRLLNTRIAVQQAALSAYWEWVAAGQSLMVFEELLAVAEERDRAFRREVTEGARAEIFLTENAQLLARRKGFVESARADFEKAAADLSIFYRDPTGRPIIPTTEDVPSSIDVSETPRETVMMEEILSAQPALRALEVALERQDASLRLARNKLLPKLDLAVEAGQDFGAIGEGGITRDESEVTAKVTFSVPLARRDARGTLRREEAARAALVQERRLQRDELRAALRKIDVDLRAAETIYALALEEERLAAEMERAERTRFRLGASDFFVVNLREEARADAEMRVINAARALAVAQVAFDAGTMDLDALGL